MRNVYLIGPTGVGKSSVGRALARALGWRFVDVDSAVERRARRTIARIFDESGETAFRRLERSAALAAARRKNVVVALGGGAPAQPGLLARLRRTGLVVGLTCARGALWGRVRGGLASRPLLAASTAAGSRRRLEDLMRRRRRAYARVDWTVSTTRLSSAEAARRIAERLRPR